MAKTEHTQGPWSAEWRNGWWSIETQRFADDVAAIHDAEATEQCGADARLIAAAPDLAAACEQALVALEHTVRRQRDMVDGTQHEAMRAVRAALEKACGS